MVERRIFPNNTMTMLNKIKIIIQNEIKGTDYSVKDCHYDWSD